MTAVGLLYRIVSPLLMAPSFTCLLSACMATKGQEALLFPRCHSRSLTKVITYMLRDLPVKLNVTCEEDICALFPWWSEVLPAKMYDESWTIVLQGFQRLFGPKFIPFFSAEIPPFVVVPSCWLSLLYISFSIVSSGFSSPRPVFFLSLLHPFPNFPGVIRGSHKQSAFFPFPFIPLCSHVLMCIFSRVIP